MKKPISFALAALLTAAALSGCGQQNAPSPAPPAQTPAVTAAPTLAPTPEPTAAPTPEPTADVSSKVATAADMTTVQQVVQEGMVPVTAESLVPGTYPVKVDSSSSMFRITDCVLTVADGKMEALLTMSGTAYPFVYPGTAEEAAAAPESDCIPYAENADGAHTFTLPVEALDAGVSCAAYSKNKELWYDRTLVFRADSLPLDAFVEGYFTTVESLGLADGTYTVPVTLSGGSGKARVTSPAPMTVAGGEATVTVEWGSPNYDYMKVDGVQYLPVNTEGNSTFAIPVSVFDRPLAVLADTTAMSTPHEIEYSLTFDSAGIAAAEG